MCHPPHRPGHAVALLLAALACVACDTRVYVRDGVTDGSRFALPADAHSDSDPVRQAWIAYSLARSICQLDMGGDNPARNSSFSCERDARETLAEHWNRSRADLTLAGKRLRATQGARYLDLMSAAYAADALDGYVWTHLRERGWSGPPDAAVARYRDWAAQHLPTQHRAETRIIGSWGYPPAL